MWTQILNEAILEIKHHAEHIYKQIYKLKNLNKKPLTLLFQVSRGKKAIVITLLNLRIILKNVWE